MGTDINLHAERFCNHQWEYAENLEEFEIRDYEFFAILANVKNPIRSTEPFDSITSNRGFPDDLSKATRNNSLLMMGHSPGWVMYRELLDFDWNKKTILRSAVVSPNLVKYFRDGKFYRHEIKEAYSMADSGPGPRVTWTESYRESVGKNYLNELFCKLDQIGHPDSVRLLFSFDS